MPVRLSRISSRRSLAVLLAASSCVYDCALAQSPGPPLDFVVVDTLPAGAAPAVTNESSEVVLQAPANELRDPTPLVTDEGQEVTSTPEMQIARRPWLLEKLTKEDTKPSVKMEPPRPPAALPDPPSTGRLKPKLPDTTGELPPIDLLTPPIRKPVISDPFDARTDQPPRDPKASGDNLLRAEPANDHPGRVSDLDENGTQTEPRPLTDVAVESIQDDQLDTRRPQDAEPTVPNSSASQYVGSDDDPEVEPQIAPEVDETVQAEPAAVPKLDLDYTGFPKQPLRLNSSVARMQNTIRQCLLYNYARPETANDRSTWGMLHAIMVYGSDTKVLVGTKTYSTIAWIAGNNFCRGQRPFEEQNGRITARSGVGLQGHQGQLLAVFSLCDVPVNYSLYAGEREYSVKDLIETEMLACKSGQELTFTLIGLAHYLDTDAEWKNAEGETWNFERLIREELAQPIVGAACGGTHRLMGYSHALRKRRAEGKPITGQWKRADIYTQDFINYAYRLQNRDGSMSTDWFEGREDNGDMDRKIQTTGHMVEWLLTITPDSQLQNPRLVSAIQFLSSTMYRERGHDWSIGPKGHALRSLAMYYERVYQRGLAWTQTPTVARTPSNSRR